MLSLHFAELYDHIMTILQETPPTKNKRLWHSWWCLRLPQSCLFGLTPQLMATGTGSFCWPQENCSVGRAIGMMDSWLMVPKNSAAKKPCCRSEKEQPGFYTLLFFWSSVAHAAACKAPASTVCCSWSDRLTAGLRLAGTSGDGLVQPPVQSKASYHSLFRATSSWVLNISKQRTPQPLWAACC